MAAQSPDPSGRRFAAAVFAAGCLIAGAFAFVGLSTGGFWTDELFTLFLIDHHGGAGEVWRRALTDTQPPLYYLLLYGWAGIAGRSEAALRALSGAMSILALAVFFVGTARLITLPGRLFATAAAAAAPFWFLQSQNARNYALCLLISSILLALALRAREAAREGRPVSPSVLAGLSVFGAVGAFTHFYEFLAVGLLYLFLIITLRQRRLTVVLTLAGAMIFGGEVAFIHALLAGTQQNIHDMWFGRSVGFFLIQGLDVLEGFFAPGTAVAVLVLAGRFVVRPRGAARQDRPHAVSIADMKWSLRLAVMMALGLVGIGIAVSLLFAPSFSARNILVASPFFWPALGLMFDAATVGARRSWVALATAAALAAQLLGQTNRWRLIDEPWRESARYVLSTSACAGAEIPVVMPGQFGPPTPFFRTLFAQDFYGRYFDGQAARLTVLTAEDLAVPARNPTLRRRLGPDADDACPILAWAVHDMDAIAARRLADRMALAAGVPRGAVTARAIWNYRMVWAFVRPNPRAWVLIRTPAPTDAPEGALAKALR